MIQERAARFIRNSKGRKLGDSGQEALGLDVLQDRKNARVRLLHKILADDPHSSSKKVLITSLLNKPLYIPM